MLPHNLLSEAKEKAAAPKNQEKTAAEALPNESAAYEESTTSTQEEV